MPQDQTVLWMAEDLDCPADSGFGRTKRAAEAFVSGNRGYDGYDGSGFPACVRDGWAQPAVRVTVPAAVAAALLRGCQV